MLAGAFELLLESPLDDEPLPDGVSFVVEAALSLPDDVSPDDVLSLDDELSLLVSDEESPELESLSPEEDPPDDEPPFGERLSVL